MVLTLTDARSSTIDTVKVLTPEEKAKVQLTEDPAMDHDYWTCTHCNKHFDNWKTHAEVAEHVKEVHGIDDLKTDEDIILGPQFSLFDRFLGTLPSN